ncbi:group II intron reverse transcriptase/maturase [Chromohalobacter marismortui]|uniref:Group II intron reverse transcriptase/maturase n=1 Tax=Chromohalobacter marismortui TaxID=42055 RepID=A0A4R7NSH1_9GAMM|nr:reverse transcriptase domain-containing protein [Chromohalobacter marismortui]TDU23531.1 group II intron reverse transcriptase/maturase [Chromohalobacter marismortui]
MSKSALRTVASPDYLKVVWKEMYDNTLPRKRNSKGRDGISINSFQEHKKEFIKRISDDIKNSRYSFWDLAPVFLPKSDGKERLICVPVVQDRLVQRAILKFLYDNGCRAETNISYGFVKGRNVSKALKEAVRLRRKKGFVYKADISSFFDNVSRESLEERVKRKVKHRSLHDLLVSTISLEVATATKAEGKRIRRQGLVLGKGVRQGMPISPFFANLILEKFDSHLISKGFSVIRYADDIIAFSESEEGCQEIENVIKDELEKVGLGIKESKSGLYDPGESVDFLGLGIVRKGKGYSVEVTDSQLQKIRAKILEVSDLDYCNARGITITQFLSRLDNICEGYKNYYGKFDNERQVDDLLVSARNNALDKMIRDVFGVDYKNLNNKKKRFIGIDE